MNPATIAKRLVLLMALLGLLLANAGSVGAAPATMHMGAYELQTATDTTAPTVVSVTPYLTPNKTYKTGDLIAFLVNFSEPVIVTEQPWVWMETGATDWQALYLAGSGSSNLQFFFHVQAGQTTADLDYRDANSLELPPLGAIKDAAGNSAVLALPAPGEAGSLSANADIVIDALAPSVTINQASGQADPTNASPINFTVVFSEPVSDFATGDVTLGGTAGATTATVTGSGTTYNVAVSGMTGDGTVIASVGAGVAHDAAGNANSASTTTDTVTYDATAPTVTVEQAAGQSDPATAGPINFTVNFSEPVTGFDSADVTLSAPAGASAAVTGSGTTYNVAVSGMTAGGTVIASLGANVAQDAAGNGNAASTSADNTVTYSPPDTTAPTVVSVTPYLTPNKTYKTGDLIAFLVNFSEPVIVTEQPWVWMETGATDWQALYLAGSGSSNLQFFFHVQAGQTTADLDYRDANSLELPPLGAIKDAAGNSAVLALPAPGEAGSLSANADIVIDALAPSVTINQASGQADPTNGSPINFTVVFSEAVSDFATGDVTLGGTAGATTATVTGSGSTYNVAVSGMTGDGTVTASIASGVAHDAAGNGNAASGSTDNQVTYNLPDTTGPSVTINQASGQTDPTNVSPINFTVIFSEAVSGFTDSDVTLSGTASGTLVGTVTEVAPNDHTAYNVAVSGMTAGGTVIASLGANVAQDAAGNGNAASTSTDNTVTFVTAPAITSGASATFTIGSTGSFTVTTTGNPTPSLRQSGTLPKGVTFTDNGNGTASLTGSPEPGSAGIYNLTFTASNRVSPDATQAFTLIVSRTEDASPVVTIQPQAQTVLAGGTATFTADASGYDSVQWQVSADGGASWNPISGATSTTLTLGNVKLEMNGYRYRAVFSNPAGSTTSKVATLTVTAAPVVTTQPSSQTVQEGGMATFAAAAGGNPSPTVQWQELCTGTGCTWSNIPNATSTTLTLSNVTLVMTNYQYRAVFTNSLGSATTAPATLTVKAAAGTGSIAGKLFNDANANGVLDKGESALGGWIVQLQDVSGGLIATAQTDSSGNYKFTGVATAKYKVRIVLQPGYVQTTPDPTEITLSSGQAITGVNFGAVVSADLKVGMAANYNANKKAIVYTIAVTNDGPAEATEATLTDVLPRGVSYDSATGAACSLAKTTVTCTLGTLASGSSATITLKVTRTDVKNAINNTATVSSGTFDFDKSDNSATAIVP